MPLPVDYDTVLVSGRYVALDGTAMSGAVTFAGKVTAIDAASRTIVVPATITATLDSTGAFSVFLPATDDANLNPNGWTYTVREGFAGGRTFELSVPVAAKAAGIDLSSVASVPPSSGSASSYVTLAAFADLSGRAVTFDSGTAHGVTLRSSFAGGEDEGQPGQFDSTSRINLESYQRADFNSYGEVIRIYSRRYDSKQMIAWYGPTSYDLTTGDPIGADKPWFWMGAHYEANDHGSVHGHWSCEVPDTTGALQTRLEMPIWDPVTGVYGMDKGVIKTNAADFNVRTSNGQEFRLSAPAGQEKPIVFSNDSNGGSTFVRWKVRASNEAETGANAGSNWLLSRYDDAGVLLDSPIFVNRGSGNVTLTPGFLVRRSTSTVTSLSLNTSSLGGGQGVLAFGETAAPPASNPTGSVVLYVQGGRLKIRQPDGTNQFVALTAV